MGLALTYRGLLSPGDEGPHHRARPLRGRTHKWLGGPRGHGRALGARLGRPGAGHPVVRERALRRVDDRQPAARARRVVLHAGRLPLLRAPLGAGRGVRLAGVARSRGGRGAHPRPGHAPEGRARFAVARPPRHAPRAGRLGGPRLLRRRRVSTRARPSRACGRRASARRSRRTRSCTCASARRCTSTRPTSTPLWTPWRGWRELRADRLAAVKSRSSCAGLRSARGGVT